MQENLKEILFTSDSEAVEMLATIIDSSDLKDKYGLILGNLSKLKIEKSRDLSNYSSKNKTIYFDEDMFDLVVLAHEFGHFMYEFFSYDEYEEEIKNNISIAQEHFSKQFINGNLIDYYERYAENKMNQYKNIELDKFEMMLENYVNNEEYNKIFELLKKAVINDYHCEIEDNEEFEKEIIKILNNNSMETIVKYIITKYGVMFANKKAMIRLNNEEPKGISMLIDLLSAINEGKYYYFSFCHKPDYYKKSNDRAFEEEFANYVALRLTNCQKALNDLGNILGYDYLIMMDKYYNIVIEKMTFEKEREL